MGVAEVLMHEITDADIRKINARSNDASSGGGARDLRFRLEFEPCLNRLFPKDVTYEGSTPFRLGAFEHYDTFGNCVVEEGVRYAFQPTKARPREVRIAQIHKVNFFLDLPNRQGGDGLLFMAFIRKTNGLPQAQYLTERQIDAPNSNRIIAAKMREAILMRRGNNAVVFSVILS